MTIQELFDHYLQCIRDGKSQAVINEAYMAYLTAMRIRNEALKFV